MDDGPDQDALQSNLAKLYERHDDSRRLKRNLKKRRYKDRRLSDDEFDELLSQDQNINDTSPLPKAFDWRTKNVASSVKNQHRCLSYYVFATVAVLESGYAIKTNFKNVIEFRPQQIVDCAKDENEGCTGGGLFQSSMKYLIEKGDKIVTDASYPYVGKYQSCRAEGINEIDLGTVEYADIPVGDEKQMAEVLINNGSIFIGYEYDEGLKPPYWIIKNSYEPSWGENGYLRLIKDDNNICGIATIESYAKLT
ncbi:unnamed protein product [Rotaria sp. Silwood1]|nr:unnamed protein product [Rotaria sp. Silwood1]